MTSPLLSLILRFAEELSRTPSLGLQRQADDTEDQEEDSTNEGIVGEGISWTGLGVGVIIFFAVFVSTRCFILRRPNRRNARSQHLRAQEGMSGGLQPHRDPLDHTRPPVSLPNRPSAVYVGGRYVLYPSPSTGTVPWAHGRQPPFTAFPAQPGVHTADGFSLAGQAPRDQPVAAPRFNPDDLISFEVTGEDMKNPCPICLCLLEEEPVSAGQCLHLMHTSCLKSWLAKDTKSACPVCRVPFYDPVESDEEEASRNSLAGATGTEQPAISGVAVR